MSDQVTGLLSPWLRNIRFSQVRHYLKGRVLDFGCGVGGLAEYCKSGSYLGVDIDEEALNKAQANCPDYMFATSVSSLVEKYDTIVAIAVIEHVSDPAELLKFFKQMLSHTGTIVITTPHPSSDQIHSIGSKLKLFSSSADEEHQQLIDYNRMEKLTFEVGLSIQKYERFLCGLNQLFLLGKNEN